MKRVIKDIKVLAYPEDGYAKAEGESADGMQFMIRQFERRDTVFDADSVNDFLNELRKLKLSFSFRCG